MSRPVPGAQYRCTPMAGPFRAELQLVQLHQRALLTGSASPAIGNAVLPPDQLVLHLALAGGETLLLNGQPMGRHTIGAFGGGAELVRANPRASHHAVLLLPMAAAEGLPSRAEAPLPGPRGFTAFQASELAWTRLAHIAREAERIAALAPHCIMVGEAARGLRAGLLDAARTALHSAMPAAGRPGRAGASAVRLVNQVGDVLEAAPGRPIYTEDLCAALGVSATGIADAFRRILGTTPHRFLKLRRLAMVHARLREPAAPPLIKAIALDHGFWHLGQFALDYRAVYGETPAQTRARALVRDRVGARPRAALPAARAAP